jgi:MerR family transcriptional regulator, redox-sensitive transcriptional activator SoxR
MAELPDRVTIGELATRAGVTTATLRFYEAEDLIAAERTSGNQRRFSRATLRRVAFIRAAQQVGLSLQDIRTALAKLPSDRTPTKTDWERLSRSWRRELDNRILALEQLRDQLTGCIGCGCLSLRRWRMASSMSSMIALGTTPSRSPTRSTATDRICSA